MNPALTILLIEDVEKPEIMTDRFVFGLSALNEVPNDVQVLAISQKERSPKLDTALAKGLIDDVVYASGPRADNGYPIWDVCQSVADIWDRVDGEYVTFAHTEFLYGPDRLTRTCQWLLNRQPVLAVGNLRRIGLNEPHWKNRLLSPNRTTEHMLDQWIDAGRADALRVIWNGMPTTHWAYWRESANNDGRWEEDIFYARRDWLDAMRFFDHADRLAFQDVYDLIKAVWLHLEAWSMAPRCHRMDRLTNDVIHLDHDRPRDAFSLACYRWFHGNRKRWADTTYGREDLWEKLLSPSSATKERHEAITDFRRAPGGTVPRFLSAFLRWFQEGGKAQLCQYYASRGLVAVESVKEEIQ